MDKQASVQPKKKLHFSIGQIVTLVIFGLGILWLIITCAVPLAIGDGVNNYTGIQKELAKRIVELTQKSNGPTSPSIMPDFMYQIRVKEIRPVTKEEVMELCKDPNYVFDDPNNFHYYAATVSEGYLLSLGRRTTHYIGCSVTDHLHGEIFGDPKGTTYSPLP